MRTTKSSSDTGVTPEMSIAILDEWELIVALRLLSRSAVDWTPAGAFKLELTRVLTNNASSDDMRGAELGPAYSEMA
ncbi:hypothetical protein PF003_g10588 [Phytophthora fragariae]|nr:hypothetical protein PF003_g10588 [Phytophthora fragariae]